MTFSTFISKYRVTHEAKNARPPASIRKRANADLLAVVAELGGKTFNEGLFRVYPGDQLEKYTEVVSRQFPDIQGNAIAFAADWLGRQFILDFTEMNDDDEPTVTCLEPGVPDSFCTDQTIIQFHNEALVDSPDAALALPLYKKWRKKQKAPISLGECVGYRVPLFLGGEDELENLDLQDMEVYLELCCQMWNKVKDLPEGTPIGDITLEDDEA